MALIEANHLCKEFKIYKRNSGAKETIKSLFHREYDIKKAVEDISFFVERGELVGYIGPNGAGKSTTIKMLSGILFPSSGEVLVDGIKPYENRKANAAKIGIVFGQRSQLFWDLPMVDGFELYQKMYKMEEKRFQENVALLYGNPGYEGIYQPSYQAIVVRAENARRTGHRVAPRPGNSLSG